jgi:hypothetical protein
MITVEMGNARVLERIRARTATAAGKGVITWGATTTADNE